jgi:hypothetical protein
MDGVMEAEAGAGKENARATASEIEKEKGTEIGEGAEAGNQRGAAAGTELMPAPREGSLDSLFCQSLAFVYSIVYLVLSRNCRSPGRYQDEWRRVDNYRPYGGDSYGGGGGAPGSEAWLEQYRFHLLAPILPFDCPIHNMRRDDTHSAPHPPNAGLVLIKC